MLLLTKALKRRLPSLYATEDEVDPVVVCKFVLADFHYAWYAIEFDGQDLFFGFIDGDFPELGYFRLSELTSLRSKSGLTLERDRLFRPCRLSTICAQLGH